MPNRSHYDVLQLESQSATPDEIKRAFRRLSMEHHPDKNGNSEESNRAFQEINEAYNVLSDPAKRGNYDFELQMGMGGHGIGGHRGPMHQMHQMHQMHHMGPMGMGHMGSVNPLDMLFAAMHQQQHHQAQHHHQQQQQHQAQHIFETVFGGSGMGMGMGPKIIIHNFTQNMNEQSAATEQSYDVNIVISLSLPDAFNGVNQRPVPIQYEDESHMVHSETILINIPPGIPNGYKVGIPGRGNIVPNSGGRRSTLHLEISIEEHPQFRREGDVDLTVEHRVSLKDALCGFTFELVHLNGRNYKFNCKPCSITGSMNETKVLPGLGYNESGALKIRFSIDLPTSLTEEQIAALSTIL
jgi:DnaJ-class molecular chaperone